MIRDILTKLSEREDLTPDEISAFIDPVPSPPVPQQSNTNFWLCVTGRTCPRSADTQAATSLVLSPFTRRPVRKDDI